LKIVLKINRNDLNKGHTMDAIIQILNFFGNYALDYGMTLIRYFFRFCTLVFFGIGLRYTIANMFGIILNPKFKNILISLSLLVGSIATTFLYNYNEIGIMIWETIIFWFVANAGYVLFGNDLCHRMDNFLDKKFGRNKD
jgi:hypothetical protein